MRRMLVIGCGGTGGAIVAYLMDQLRSDLAARGIESIPDCWQFVHVDVPLTPERVADGLGTVVDQGGRYISCGPFTGQYQLVDDALSSSLQARGDAALGHIATWAPREPRRIDVAVTEGAGQLRAIGRMLTLSNITRVHTELESAWQRLSTVEATRQMSDATRRLLTLGKAEHDAPPVVFVVSSMAGGAGASMALDVCRIAVEIGADPQLTGVFMASADVFDELPEAARTGVRPNALAMLGEIVAAQTGAAHTHDTEVLRALGIPGGSPPSVPFARVFPIGRFVGAERVQFGNGTRDSVYRGVGRALAAVMLSGQVLHELTAYDFTNSNPVDTDSRLFGWGDSRSSRLQWGALGYAALSMGGERYAEYAAQRLARSCVDRLREGHLTPNDTTSGTEQARRLVESQWAQVCDRLGLPSTGGQSPEVMAWATTRLMTREEATSATRAVVSERLQPHLPSAQAGVQASQFVSTLDARIASSRTEVVQGAKTAAYSWAYEWAQGLQDRFDAELRDAVAKHGLAYAAELLRRLRLHLVEGVAPALAVLSRSGPADPVEMPSRSRKILASLKGVLTQGQAILDDVLRDYDAQLSAYIRAEACGLASNLLNSFANQVIDPADEAVVEAHHILDQAAQDRSDHFGLARLKTELYSAWPHDAEHRVARRWEAADNEVLVADAADFGAQYVEDLRRSLPFADGGTPPIFDDARPAAAAQVISGIWPTTGSEKAPDGLIRRTAMWRPRELPTDPHTREPLTPTRARYDVHVRPAELLARSRSYVARPGESFRAYTDVSLRDYVSAGAESERAARQADIVGKFRSALSLALPLIGLDDVTVQTVHKQPVQYRYKLSEVPFQGLPILDDLVAVLESAPRTDPGIGATLRQRDGATGDDSIQRIDIFGSYKNYAPVVYGSVLRPIVEQWARAASPTERHNFWALRRSRPLPASLPLTDIDRQTMVTGWLLGQIIGRVRLPASPDAGPVLIWDDAAREWVPFPHPLLTPAADFVSKNDLLPAVLESVLVAMAQIGASPVGSSLRPYRLLRELCDDQPTPTNTVSGVTRLHGHDLLAQWCRDGVTPPEGVSRVSAAATATTAAERAAAVEAWLQAGPEKAVAAFSQPMPRAGTGLSPLRDVAPDLRHACGQIRQWLATAEDTSHGISDF